MTTKTTTKLKETKKEPNDDMIVNMLNQLDILTKSINMINDDMDVICNKIEKLTSRLGIE